MTKEFVIHIRWPRQSGGSGYVDDYLREGKGMVTFHSIAGAAQVAQLLNQLAVGKAIYRAVDANGNEVGR